MGAEGMVGIAMRSRGAAAAAADGEVPQAVKDQMAAMIKPYIDPIRVAGHGFVDDVIDPRDTRSVIARGIELGRNKVVERPWRRNGVRPV
jgi:acetyl-CoA carboxylase carboxyltransferase component